TVLPPAEKGSACVLTEGGGPRFSTEITGFATTICATVYVPGGTDCNPSIVRSPRKRAKSTVVGVLSTVCAPVTVPLLMPVPSVMLSIVTRNDSTDGMGESWPVTTTILFCCAVGELRLPPQPLRVASVMRTMRNRPKANRRIQPPEIGIWGNNGQPNNLAAHPEPSIA